MGQQAAEGRLPLPQCGRRWLSICRCLPSGGIRLGANLGFGSDPRTPSLSVPSKAPGGIFLPRKCGSGDSERAPLPKVGLPPRHPAAASVPRGRGKPWRDGLREALPMETGPIRGMASPVFVRWRPSPPPPGSGAWPSVLTSSCGSYCIRVRWTLPLASGRGQCPCGLCEPCVSRTSPHTPPIPCPCTYLAAWASKTVLLQRRQLTTNWDTVV